MRGFVTLLTCVLTAGIGALSWVTDGFRVVTSEGARRLAVERSPLSFPDIAMIDQNGQQFSLADYYGRTVLVDFIYTRCPTICGVLGDDFRNVLGLAHADEAGDIDLLSISFDPEHDDRGALQLYGERYGAAAPRWRVAAPVDRHDLEILLRSFGTVVISDGIGGFVHSSAVYLIDSRGRLTRILDPDAPSSLFAAAAREAAR
jgi:protein SCO1/2